MTKSDVLKEVMRMAIMSVKKISSIVENVRRSIIRSEAKSWNERLILWNGSDFMNISNTQQTKLFDINNILDTQLSNISYELANLCKILDDCEISSYYTWSIRERISEAKIRVDMAKIRNDEFLEEINNKKLSESGFY
jgi:hypothetical protein